MTCKQFVEFLEQYVSGELPGDVRGTLESHLPTCGNCRRYFASYQNTVRVAAGAAKHPDDDPPGKVPDELVRAILSAGRRAKR